MKAVVLCADDFGLTEGVSRGILELAEAGRLSATSVMSGLPAWRTMAPALRSLGDRVAVGLHLNLTTASPMGAMPGVAPSGTFPALQELIQRAYTGRLPPVEVRAEIDRQLDAFEEVYGGPPAFVDGHQHVHVLPVVRSALLSALRERGLQGKLWLRDPTDGMTAIIRRELSANKALVVKALAIGFRRAAKAAGFETNEGFSGFSPFDAAISAERVFAQALVALGPRPLVMVHPGYVDEPLASLDSVTEPRQRELDFLRSEEFRTMLDARGVFLATAPGGR